MKKKKLTAEEIANRQAVKEQEHAIKRLSENQAYARKHGLLTISQWIEQLRIEKGQNQ